MPVRSSAIGSGLTPLDYEVSKRRVLAFAAGLHDKDHLNDDDESFVVLPQFCVVPEWKLVSSGRSEDLGLTAAESRMVVHAGQDSTFHRLVTPEKKLRLTGKILSVHGSSAGSVVVSRYETWATETSQLLTTTTSTTIYRGIETCGESIGRPARTVPIPSFPIQESHAIPLDRGFPHRYSECADIWNPIHSERGAARGAGLPDIVVHGTALWALAGQVIVRRYCDGNPRKLRRLSGRFSAMVIAGESIEIDIGRLGSDVRFSVKNEAGDVAVSHGRAVVA